MATKRNPAQTEEQLLEQPTEEAQKDANEQLKAQQAEIEKLKAQLAAMQTRPVAQNDAEVVRAACREAAEKGVDPWQIKVNVRAPRRPGKEDPWYWLNVNGLSVQIPADDRYHSLKLPWACVLVDLLRYEKASLDYQDSLEVYDPETNPHRG